MFFKLTRDGKREIPSKFNPAKDAPFLPKSREMLSAARECVVDATHTESPDSISKYQCAINKYENIIRSLKVANSSRYSFRYKLEIDFVKEELETVKMLFKATLEGNGLEAMEYKDEYMKLFIWGDEYAEY